MSDLINIEEKDGQLLVTSLEVAENFGKLHRNVMQSIRNLTAQKSAVKNMFYETTYENSRGQEQPMYLMNRDGFSLLVMGFTGKEALAWKLKYINAFNEMEQKLKQHRLPSTYKEALLQLVEQVEANEKLELENAEMKPKASYYDTVLNCENAVSITTIAKDYNWTAQKMNKYLHEKGVQYKQGDTWVLYKKYAEKYKGDNKITDTKTLSTTGRDGKDYAHIHTYWTQKGRLFIYDLLKNDGILPTIEKEKGE